MTVEDFLKYALPFLGAAVGGFIGALINMWLDSRRGLGS